MGKRLGVGEIVDSNEFNIGILERGAQHVATDASETVNADFDCHLASLKMMKIRLKRMRGREHKMLTGKEEVSKCGWAAKARFGKAVGTGHYARVTQNPASSIKMFLLLQKRVIRASQFFCLIVLWAVGQAS